MCFRDQNIIAENSNCFSNISTFRQKTEWSTDIHSYMFYTIQFYNKVPDKTAIKYLCTKLTGHSHFTFYVGTYLLLVNMFNATECFSRVAAFDGNCQHIIALSSEKSLYSRFCAFAFFGDKRGAEKP